MDTAVLKCDTCGGEIRIGDYPFCRGDATRHAPMESYGVVPDDIPGGLEIKNGLCNPDGSPKKYYSRKEIEREAARRGMMNYVVHQPTRGSDKNKFHHTQRFI